MTLTQTLSLTLTLMLTLYITQLLWPWYRFWPYIDTFSHCLQYWLLFQTMTLPAMSKSCLTVFVVETSNGAVRVISDKEKEKETLTNDGTNMHLLTTWKMTWNEIKWHTWLNSATICSFLIATLNQCHVRGWFISASLSETCGILPLQ